MLKHARSFATLSICRPMSQLPIGTSLSVSTAGPIYPLSWTRISSKKPRPSPGGTACPCASSSRRGLDGRLLGELRFVEIRASSIAYQGCPLLRVDLPWSRLLDTSTGTWEDDPG